MKIRIKENSWLAKLAAYKLNVKCCAIVIGTTIHLYNASKSEFISNTTWLRHEICHVNQWKKKGYLFFLFHYLWLSFLHGYWRNPYEIEARESEGNSQILNDIELE